MAAPQHENFKPPVIPAVKGWFYPSNIDPALLEYDKTKPVVETVKGSIHSPQPESASLEYDKIESVIEAQAMRPTQVWSNVHVNNVTKADTPSFIEQCLASSSPRIVQNIEADDACSLARDTLERAARAALQAMSSNVISIAQAGEGTRKREDHSGEEGHDTGYSAQVTLSRAPLQVKSSNFANTARPRNEKRKIA